MEHFSPFTPNEEQLKNNPNKYWDGFLGQKVRLVSEKIKEAGNVADSSVSKALDDAMGEIPKNKADFISKDEILIRALELYAKENGGFVNEKLKKEYIDKTADFLAYKLREFDFDTVDQELQKEIIEIQESEALNPEDMKALREKFGNSFSEFKMKEYE